MSIAGGGKDASRTRVRAPPPKFLSAPPKYLLTTMGGPAPRVQLTKKQRKSAAFRERKRKDVRDVPEQDEDGGDGDESGWVDDDEPVAPLISEPKPKSKPDKKAKAKAKSEPAPEVEAEPAPAPAKTVKRKRSVAQIDADAKGGPAAPPPAKPKKKRKVAVPAAEGEASEPDTRRKILFLGARARLRPPRPA
jgi:hypothetical protein